MTDISALDPHATAVETPNRPLEHFLEFSDNTLLIDLCGPFDEYLATIEAALEVQIVRRGNKLTLAGDRNAVSRAGEILGHLYGRLEAGKEVDLPVVEGAIRMGAEIFDTSMSEKQPDMFKGGVMEIPTRKKTISPRTKAQATFVKSLYEKELCFGIGPAGTGKTYLAVAVGVSMYLSGQVERIILSRPAVEAGERLGFLPGDMKDKVDPYMQPLYDALNDFLPGKQLGKLIEEKKIEIAPLAFMRGRTLSNAFVVLDEAQNATSMQMKMFLTRLGEGSRMAITGDRSQIDLPRGVKSGLRDAEDKLGDIHKIAFNYFTAKDVVRHHLVAEIIKAYDLKDD
ncbi:MAG: PhoH family protein [Halocynthiibacter sp.]